MSEEEYPEIFVKYAREKLKKDRTLIEYLAKFGRPISKGGALMILDAAGEGDKNG